MKAKARAEAARDRGLSERLVIGHFKARWLVSVVGSLIVLGFVIWSVI